MSWSSAAAVYSKAKLQNSALQDQGLKLVEYLDRSIDGTTKSTALFEAHVKAPCASDPAGQKPTLIVAVRGSKHGVDHMVNANYESRSLDILLVGHTF